jgi:hypothetical protein
VAALRRTVSTARSATEVGQPAQRAETRQEQVLAAPRGDKALDAVQATPDGALRDREDARAVVVAREQVLNVLNACVIFAALAVSWTVMVGLEAYHMSASTIFVASQSTMCGSAALG